MKDYEVWKQYFKNVSDLILLGNVNVATQLNEAYRGSVMEHNEVVKKKSRNIVENNLRYQILCQFYTSIARVR